jgi:hypothetical protein
MKVKAGHPGVRGKLTFFPKLFGLGRYFPRFISGKALLKLFY